MERNYLLKSEICDEMGFESFETMAFVSFEVALACFYDKINKIDYKKTDLNILNDSLGKLYVSRG